MVKRLIRFLRYYTDIKSIYFNFKTLPFEQAIKMPVKLSSNVVLRNLQGKIIIDSKVFFRGMIEIGYGDVTHIDKRYPRTIIDLKGIIVFKGPAHIGHGSSLRVEGKLELGDQFRITARSTIVAKKEVIFGNKCLLSWDILVMDTDFHNITDLNGVILNKPTEIIIGNKVWIGCRSTILKGAKIPDSSIVGANSIVTKEFNNGSVIIAGQPGKVVKENIAWN